MNKYYKKNKEKFWKEARERYQNFSEDKKEETDIKIALKKKKKKGEKSLEANITIFLTKKNKRSISSWSK